jgi:hypothetical protein
MDKKCASCGIRLDVPCTHPACDGHHNERRGEVCAYCAMNERENRLFMQERSNPFRSSLAEIGHGED